MKKFCYGIILIIICALTFGACSNEATNSPDGIGIGNVTQIETVYIGALFPSNSAQAETITEIKTAMQLAADIINEEHDLDWDLAQSAGLPNYGHARIELVFADCGLTAADAKQATQQLIDQGVSLIIGCYDATLTEAAAEICLQNGVPMISGSARGDDLTGGSKIFTKVFNRIAMTSEQETALFLNYLNQYNLTANAGIKKVAIAYINNDYGVQTEEKLEAALAGTGLEVVAVVEYNPGDTDLTETAAKMISNQPDAIFQISSSEDLIALTEAYSNAKFTPSQALCFGSGFQQSAFVRKTSELNVDFYSGVSICPDILYSDGNDEQTDAREAASDIFSYINQQYRKTTQKDLSDTAYLEFAAVIVAAQAVDQAGTTDKETLITTLRETVFPAPYLYSGSIDFDDNGQNIVMAGYISNLSDGLYHWVFSPQQAVANSGNNNNNSNNSSTGTTDNSKNAV